MDAAKNLVQPPPPSSSATASSSKAIINDPLSLVSSELSSLRSNVSSLLGSGHPSLDTIAKYYFQAEGKHVRPLIVLLMSKATNGISPLWPGLIPQQPRIESGTAIERDMGIDKPLSPRSVLNDFNPHMTSIEGALPSSSSASPESISASGILPTQRRLAEITEMIHVASLLHDDVIDASPLRRGAPSAPNAFGNRLSILGGDFLLGRASVALARLRDNEVVELLATVIANLVEGEVMQLKAQESQADAAWDADGIAAHRIGLTSVPRGGPTPGQFSLYLQKTYLKTAALIAKSTRAAVILGGCGSEAVQRAHLSPEQVERCRAVRDAAYGYGRNLGIAFQLVDDLLDFESTSAAFGKPSGGADLRLGLATAPVLYTWQEMPNEGVEEMILRRFEGEGDVEKMLGLVRKSRGLERTALLAKAHAESARKALEVLPESEARTALEKLNEQVINRVR